MSVDSPLPTGASHPPANPSRSGAARRTVLLVEDEEVIRAFVQTVLEQAGYSVVPAADGRAGGELFAATPDQFDLLLTDVLMPHATGLELVARVRQVRPQIPVVFMSAFTGGPPLASDSLPPEEQLIEKPFTGASLLTVFSAALVSGHSDETISDS